MPHALLLARYGFDYRDPQEYVSATIPREGDDVTSTCEGDGADAGVKTSAGAGVETGSDDTVTPAPDGNQQASNGAVLQSEAALTRKRGIYHRHRRDKNGNGVFSTTKAGGDAWQLAKSFERAKSQRIIAEPQKETVATPPVAKPPSPAELKLDLQKVQHRESPKRAARVVLRQGSVAPEDKEYDIEAVLETVDANRDPADNSCPLCVPGARCPVCCFHKKWVSRMVRKRHQQVLEFDPPYIMSSSDSDGEEGPEGIGEPREYWNVRHLGSWQAEGVSVCRVNHAFPSSAAPRQTTHAAD